MEKLIKENNTSISPGINITILQDSKEILDADQENIIEEFRKHAETDSKISVCKYAEDAEK